MSSLNIGDKATDFTLSDYKENKISLSDYKGKKVLLSFYPLAFTPVWKSQIGSLEENYETFTEKNTVVMAISIDSPYANAAWAKELNSEKVIILSDFWPHGLVASNYGVFREKEGFSERANILIDENQKIIFKKVYQLDELPEFQEIIDLL